MFAPGAVQRRLNMAVSDENNREFVDGIVEDYITPTLTDPGCYYSEFLVRIGPRTFRHEVFPAFTPVSVYESRVNIV